MEKQMFLPSIYSILILDSFSFGLITPILGPEILNAGGCHTLLGIFLTLQILLNSFANCFTQTLIEKIEKKWTLIIELTVGLLTNFLMGLATNHWQLFLLRCVFNATNQLETICNYNTSSLKKEERINDSMMKLLNSFGFLLGVVLGGALYDMINGFYKITFISCLCSITCLAIATFLPKKRGIQNTKKRNDSNSLLHKLKIKIMNFQKNTNSMTSSNRKIFLNLHFFINAGLSVFYIKFSLLLNVHYGSTFFITGCIIAYQTIIPYLVNILISLYIKEIGDKSKIGKYLEFCLVGLILSMMGVCFSPSYTIYLVSFLILCLMQSSFDHYLREIEDGFEPEKEKNVNNLKKEYWKEEKKTVLTLSNLLTPLFLGLGCDIFNHLAIKALSILPLLYSYNFVNNIEKKAESKKEN